MPKLHRVIDDLSPEELEKVHALKASSAQKPESFWYKPSERLLGELGCYYGWQAVVDVSSGRVSFRSVPGLVASARSMRIQQRLENLEDMRMAFAAAIGAKGIDSIYKNYFNKLERQL